MWDKEEGGIVGGWSIFGNIELIKVILFIIVCYIVEFIDIFEWKINFFLNLNIVVIIFGIFSF